MNLAAMTAVREPGLILVSNRLPVTVRQEDGEISLTPSGGGLATGLRGAREKRGGVWIGWPGDVSGTQNRGEVDRKLEAMSAVPVYLTHREQKAFYEDFSNAAIWPVFHDLIEQLPQDIIGWTTYESVNRKFADAVLANYHEGDVIWINDYHLMLVPRLVREALPASDNRILSAHTVPAARGLPGAAAAHGVADGFAGRGP